MNVLGLISAVSIAVASIRRLRAKRSNQIKHPIRFQPDWTVINHRRRPAFTTWDQSNNDWQLIMLPVRRAICYELRQPIRTNKLRILDISEEGHPIFEWDAPDKLRLRIVGLLNQKGFVLC